MRIKLGIPLRLSEICLATGGRMSGNDCLIEYICTDSREILANTVFFALGQGEAYVNDALKTGYAVSSSNKNCLLVKSTSDALLSLASYYITRLSNLKKTVMITGSVGKTTVKNYAAAILKNKFLVHKTEGNFNNGIGLPLTVLSAPKDTEVLVLEAGMNRSGEIERLSLAARPDIAVITLIGTAHIGNLGSREAIAKAKREVLSGLKVGGSVIIPSGEPLLNDIKGCSTVGDGGDAKVIIKMQSTDSITFELFLSGSVIGDISLPLGGAHLAYDLALAALAAAHAGMNQNEIKDAILNKSVFIQRQKIVAFKDFSVYDDSYNASFEAYVADFELLSTHKGHTGAVIGDILELGDSAEKIHYELGREAARHGINALFPFGNHAEAVRRGALDAGFPEDAIFVNSDAAAHALTAKLIVENTARGGLVLIKGSRKIQAEKIIPYIKKALGEKND